MALFKILRGGKDSLQDKTIQDGWAYFTPEDKGFYIDVNGAVNNISYNSRLKINEKSFIIYTTLSSSDTDQEKTITCTPSYFPFSPSCYNISFELNEEVLSNYSISEYFNIRSCFTKLNLRYTETKSSFDSDFVLTLKYDNITSLGTNLEIPIKIIITPKEITSYSV